MDIERYLLPCLNKNIFGIDCLGCGLQRSFIQMIEGNFTSSFIQFPALYTTLLFILAVGLHFVDKSRNYSKLLIGTALANAIVMVSAYLFKMSILF